MDLNEVAVFIEVVRAGSFSQAARRLGMPNSTVSAKVSALEKRLGITLIQRTTRRLNITPLGLAYFKKCLHGLEEIQGAEDAIAAAQGEPQGLLRVTAPTDLGTSLMSGIVSRFLHRYPKVNVEVLLTDRRVELLAENVDLAIRAGPLKDSTLIAKKLGAVCFAPFATPKYLKARGEPSHPRELSQHQVLNFTPLGFEEWNLYGPRGALHVAVQGRVVINDLHVLLRLTVMGDGIALLPTYLVQDEIQAGRLVRVLKEWRTPLSPVHFVYPAQKFVAPKLSAFIAMASEEFREFLREP